MTAMLTGQTASFNVRDFGASGRKAENAQAAIQQAIDACAAAGGGTVFVPPGDYTTGTLHLRSHVRMYVEAGATVYSSKTPADFSKGALFYGEDLENITLEGRGTIDGQAEYEWRLNDLQDWYIYPNQVLWERAGRPLMRPFPTANSVGHLVLLIRCKDIRITSLSFVRSPSWTMHLFACERLVIEGVYIRTSLKEGVWADGIDPDGCRDVRISNCTVETGDDALVFYSSGAYGPPRPCENITVTNCRFRSASSGIKFCDGNLTAIRNVTIDNCLVTGTNRGLAFMSFDGGVVENVIVSNLVVECRRFDWFWWGDGDPLHFNLIQRHEIDPTVDRANEPLVGAIRNVLVRNVVARGPGACLIHGHLDSPLADITLEHVRLAIASGGDTPLQKSGNALTVENARRFGLRDVEIVWEDPCAARWRRALLLENVQGVTLDNVSAPRPPNGAQGPAVVFTKVTDAQVRNCCLWA